MTTERSRPSSVRAVAFSLCALIALLPTAAAQAAGKAAGKKAAAKSAAPLGAESPQALVERVSKAAEKQDFAELAACLAPGDRAMMSMMMVLAVTMMTAFSQMGSEMASGMAEAFQDEESMTSEEKAKAAADKKEMEEQTAAVAKKIETVLAKHGIVDLMEKTPEPEPGSDPMKNAEKLFADVDQVALITDLMAIMNESFKDAEKGEGGPPMGKIPSGKLADLKIAGDTASGKVDGEDVRFVKVDGRWYLEMLDEEKTE